MKRPLAYITAAWYGGDMENAELVAADVAGQIRENVYSILRQEQREQQPRRVQDMER